VYAQITILRRAEEANMSRTKRAAIYMRVSTNNGQTTENQRLELEKIAAARGWRVVEVYEDTGISGAKGREKRPGLDRLLKDAGRRKFDVVMTWAIDRIGRSLIDLLNIIQHLDAVGVDLYLDQQHLDTTTPAGRLLFQITGAFAEYERGMIRERIKAGLQRARAQGKRLGRAKVADDIDRAVRASLASGTGILKTARMLGIGTKTVQRIKAEIVAAS
jgi:DNA invertase Pin-like site-specific DNA recombinase